MSHRDFIKLLRSSDYSDLKLIVGPDLEIFHVHRAIVCIKSKFFEAACKESFQEGQKREIKLPEIKSSTMRSVLEWMYKGELDFSLKVHQPLILDIYAAADYFVIGELQNYIENYLANDLSYSSMERSIKLTDHMKILKDLFHLLPEGHRKSRLNGVGVNFVDKQSQETLADFFRKNSETSFNAFIADFFFEALKEAVCLECKHSMIKDYSMTHRACYIREHGDSSQSSDSSDFP